MEDILVPAAIAAASASVGGLVCYFMARRGAIVACLVTLAVLAGLLLWMWIEANAAVGWDALGYAIFGMFFLLPALAGGAIGTAWGRHRRNKACR